MKQQHNAILAKHSLEKAEKAIQEGYKNIDISLTIVQNRAYYAVFFAVIALGYLDGFVTSSHHQLMGWFNKKYIYQDKIFSFSLNKIYSRLIRNREFFDYSLIEEPIIENVLKDIEDAKFFIETVKPYLLEKLGKESQDSTE